MKFFDFKKFIYKKFVYNQSYQGGRNRLGRITVRHRGSACKPKRKYLMINFAHSIRNLSFIILQIRPSPRRKSFVALLLYSNGLFSYTLIPSKLKIGTIFLKAQLNSFSILKIGSYIKLKRLVEGISICNIELKLGCGSKVARAPGTSAKVINRFPNKYNKVLVKFRSGEEYLINSNCTAVLGTMSNPDFFLKDLKKAGVTRYYGFRSKVRGVAMNPVDHAHGGRTPGGHPCMTPSGKLTKGVKTRKLIISKKVIFRRSNFYLLQKRSKKTSFKKKKKKKNNLINVKFNF